MEKMRYGDMRLVQCSGASNSVYLIPAQDDGKGPEVFVWGTVGSGCPEPAWHHRWLHVCRVPDRAQPEAIEAALREHEAELLEVAGFYVGAVWNGNNHVGSWGGEETDHDRIDVLCQEISESLSSVETRWEASDWYATVTVYEVVASDLDLVDLVSHEVHTAAGDAALDADDVRDWILCAAQKWLDNHEDSEDDDARDATLRARLTKLLADS